MAKPEFLSVLPNPWTHIDTDGQRYAHPAGWILHDPKIYPPQSQQRVGCEIASVEVLQKAKETRIAGRRRTVSVLQEAPLQRTRFKYTHEPIRVHNTAYYRNEIQQGHLIAADVVTAAECRITEEEFIEPAVLLARYRSQAIAEMLASNPNAPEPTEPLTDAPESDAEAAPVSSADD